LFTILIIGIIHIATLPLELLLLFLLLVLRLKLLRLPARPLRLLPLIQLRYILTVALLQQFYVIELYEFLFVQMEVLAHQDR
jgi:hypothetical protein